MLRPEDAGEATDRRIARAVARWTGAPGEPRPYTRDASVSSSLLALMERFGRRGQLAEARINDRDAFLYICARSNGETFAQGLGSTPALAICDAFLHAREDEPGPRETPAPAAKPPVEPLFHAVGFDPQAPKDQPASECVNCGWEGSAPANDPRRCPSCHRHFLRLSHRNTR